MRKRWLSTLHPLAKQDPRIVFLGSDLSADPAMKKFQQDIPDRFSMEGVSEAHLVGMAAGLASTGKIVYVNTIASFLTRRCFEQIVIDVALANANVRLLAGGGGLVYGPLGPTHLALDDVAILRAVPNMTVVVPADPDEIERVIHASVDHQGPMYIRVAKGGEPIVSRASDGYAIGKSILLAPPGEVLIVACGVMVKTALDAAESLRASGIKAGVLNMHTVKPLDSAGLFKAAEHCKLLVTLEEHSLVGGLGTAVAEELVDSGRAGGVRLLRLALEDTFPMTYGTQEVLLAEYGLDVASAVRKIRGCLAGAT